jgi:uncharacterized protein
MIIPFKYGKIVDNEHFTNRTSEIEHIKNNFISQINTIIISPRRWGKSSLVLKAGKEASKNKKIKMCYIDLYKVRTYQDFYELLINEVLKSTNNKMDEFLASSRDWLQAIMPRFSYSPIPDNEISISFNWNDIEHNQDQILNMAEEIAKKKNIQLIIAIDEFQNITSLDDHIAFQKRLRANWQTHNHVTYCLYGSKRHMLMDVFTNQSMPFYKFGDILFLKKISADHWKDYIQNTFKSSGKEISEDSALLICNLADHHSFYVQQLAQICWLYTDKNCDNEIVNKAHEALIDQMSMVFQNLVDQLSKTQINYLLAILKSEVNLSSKEKISKYNLGSSANIQKIKAALENKEILDFQNNTITFNDPLFSSWLKLVYFKI